MRKVLFVVGITILLLIIAFIGCLEGDKKESHQTESKAIYVDDDGDGNYTNIQEAINAADDGDTIYVYSGYYQENLVVATTLNIIGIASELGGGEGTGRPIVDGNNDDSVFHLTASYSVIDNFEIINADDYWPHAGIEVNKKHSTCGFEIKNNDISSCNIGIYIGLSSGNTISKNEVYSNTCGIYLDWSSNNEITDNNIHSHDGWVYYGLELFESSNNNIIENNFSDNTRGIKIEENSDNNNIYHNRFEDNDVNAQDECSNTWDNDYPSGGNYWSDYTGIDSDDDGIGDTPYNISIGSRSNQDRYPLVDPVDI